MSMLIETANWVSVSHPQVARKYVIVEELETITPMAIPEAPRTAVPIQAMTGTTRLPESTRTLFAKKD